MVEMLDSRVRIETRSIVEKQRTTVSTTREMENCEL